MSNGKPSFVLETRIESTAQKIWDALTQSQHMQEYHFARAELRGELKVGGRHDLYRPDGHMMLGGEIIAMDPPKRLETTFEPGWEGPDPTITRCVYEIDEQEDACVLTILHYDLPEGETGIADGWRSIAENLKAYLEGGEVKQLGTEETA
ncbi:MAG: SRPBCC domain-containing protein [Pseudomonadota bacterium]